ncbi:CHAT domain-containing protein [Leptolyngbya cf. ectocarpi LEGE 11479]|uniref:CHAT domain-containing protein n=1 Tax=Leptolyngbya cf. ectocarpi LEGE 11479 TaxID=1828722 RepID=A0A928X301_LEPEC|nr:CHAT domain-containing protein [Leptolyngbya ectocarpi]MBE9065603.1 CHAT domain-containing protein [Leptolyngbya cf. ectocarpi LEGE 11479]
MLSVLIAVNGPALATLGHPDTRPAPSPLSAQAHSPLQEGIRLYQAEQFTAAVDIWKQALQDSTSLDRALILSNLSLAYQHLGQWTLANESIAQSLSLLESLTELKDSPAYAETLAKAWNTQGRLHWATGETQAALTAWQTATAKYYQAGHQQGILLSLLNQAKALQTLGLHLQSKEILDNIYGVLKQGQLEPEQQATGLWQLGNAERQVGALKPSQEHLQKSLEIIDTYQLETLQGPVLLDLGNTERALGDSNSAIGKTDKAQGHKNLALKLYQQVASESSASSITRLQAGLNQLSLLIATEQWSAAQALWKTLLPQANRLAPSRTAIYSQLNLAKSLMQLLQEDIDQNQTLATKQTCGEQPCLPTEQDIDTILTGAIAQSQELQDTIAESYGVGQRGELYEITHQWGKAQRLTSRALQMTEAMSYADGRYRWEWQQGRLFKQVGQQDEAIKSYRNAVNTLKTIRKNLLFIDAEVQFSFRDNVEPIYRELVELLLSHSSESQPDNQKLELAIEQIDSLQLSELENFLRCDLATTTAISQFEADDDTAILYPIILQERLAVILQLKDKKIFTEVSVDQPTIEATLKQLRQDLSKSPSRTPEVKETAQTVYNWLIREVDSELQHYDIKNLVFVLDGSLRNIPMAVLHDGNQYLIEKYAIAVAPELELFTPRPLPKDLKVFTGGVGQPQQIDERTFPPIQMLTDELDTISALYGSPPPLTDEQFQPETLQEQLSTGEFSGIHIKTHGIFSSDPEETFIVAYEQLIRGQELGNLIQTASLQGETPIDLLVLSACSTAEGDKRAILGLAGIAVRAGARSTLSTLWEAQDTPNTQLMIRFYEELKQSGTTRAQALQKAQLALMENGYHAPHLWATYVLVGNWL